MSVEQKFVLQKCSSDSWPPPVLNRDELALWLAAIPSPSARKREKLWRRRPHAQESVCFLLCNISAEYRRLSLDTLTPRGQQPNFGLDQETLCTVRDLQELKVL
jgi:hypothetical protein